MIQKILLFVLMACLSACTFTNQKNAPGEAGLGGVDFSCTPVDFAQVQRQIFGNPTESSAGKCIACHGPNDGNMILTSYSAIFPRLAQIEDAVRNNRMPKNGPPLSESSKQLLSAWIQQGAPENIDPAVPLETCTEGGTGGGNQPIALVPTYESLFENIFNVRCLSCHDSSGTQSSFDFSTYESIISYKKLFKTPSEGGDSRFVKALATGEMPEKSTPLSPEQVAVVREWVARGLPEREGDPGIDLGETPPPVKPPPAPVDTPIEGCDQIDFQTVNTKVFEAKCTGCHDDTIATDLQSYDNIKFHLNKIKIMIVNDKMPPKKPLTPDLKDLVLKWIDQGAPQTVTVPPSCSSAPPPPVVDLPVVTPPVVLPSVTCIDYQFIKEQVFEQRCVGCHGTKGGVNLETYSNVKLHLSKVEMMVSTDQMPPKKPLEPTSKKYLLDWIKNGAPEKTPESCAKPIVEPLKPLIATYNSMREHFLEAKCIVCHSGSPFIKTSENDKGTPNSKKPDFSSYKVMVSQSWLFDFKKPHKSEILDVIYDGEMPPSNSSAKALTSVESQILLEWIQKGLPEG